MEVSKFPSGAWVNRQSPLHAHFCLLPFPPLPPLLSNTETLHSRIPSPRKPRRGVEQRQMAALAQNNKSPYCLGIFYLIYNPPPPFISSCYITESLRNDSPEDETVTNEITPSVLMGHVACQLYSYLKWPEMISNCCSEQTGSPEWTTLTMRCSTAPSSCVPEERKMAGLYKWNTLFNNKP